MDDKPEKSQRTVYTIIEKPGKKAFWMKIGIARINQDHSWNVYLDALPFDRKLQIRDEELKPRPQGHGHGNGDERLPPLPSFDGGGIQ